MPIAAPVLVLAMISSAQQPVVSKAPALVAHTRSGQTITIERPAPKTRSYIVEFREAPRARRTMIERFANESGKRQRITHEFSRAFHGVSMTLDESEAAAIRRFAYVKAVHEDTAVHALADEDKTRLARIGAERVWTELSARGKGIDVAVIDSGVDYKHPSLASRYAGGWDFVDADDDAMDEHGHGTHVAGIVAGTTPDVPGVAPEARIHAYRVLDEGGSGWSSNVVAAIERAMDPNGDGDYSDRLDVANLSLGGYGDADDPTSLAADRATSAGVVVVIAAGNRPGGQTVGSPGSSRLAITVGSADLEDALAAYSSRGPAFPDFHVKPDVVAPGNDIRSAQLGGGTSVHSGTSMAAPHVAGAAALLLELHPEWTPEEVKAALSATAKPIDVDVMSQGAGRIDVFGAARARAVASPAVISLGRNPRPADWTSTGTVRITNYASQPRTFTASAASAEGVAIAIEPSLFSLDPGASRDVVVTASIAASANAAAATLSHGGRVSFTSEDGVTTLPWAAVEAALVTVRAREFADRVVWACGSEYSSVTDRAKDGASSTLLPHGDCELVTMADDGMEPIALVMQGYAIDGDRELAIDRSLAPHMVRLEGLGPDGRPIGEMGYTPAAPYYLSYSVRFGEGFPFHGISIITQAHVPLTVSELRNGASVGGGEVLYDFARSRIVGIQHQPLSQITGNVTLTTLPGDLHRARLEIAPRPGTLRGWTWSLNHATGGGAVYSSGHGFPLVNGWSGSVYLTEDGSDQALFGAGVHTEDFPAVPLDLATLAMRAIDGQIVFSNDRIPAPTAYGVPDDATMRIGEQLTSPRTFLARGNSSIEMSVLNVGAAGEWRYGLGKLDWELRRANGEMVATGRTGYTIVADPQKRGPLQLDVTTQRMSRLSLTFDTSRDDFNPPVITSMRVEDGWLRLSTGDYQIIGDDVRCYELRHTRAFVRAGGGAWRELALTEVLNDRGEELGHYETGTWYRALLGATGVVDLRVEMEDLAGNASTVTIENILEMPLRRRASGK